MAKSSDKDRQLYYADNQEELSSGVKRQCRQRKFLYYSLTFLVTANYQQPQKEAIQ